MTAERVADQMIERGYFKFTSQLEREVARSELIASLNAGYISTEWDEQCISRDRRIYPADSEELAEGGIGEFILLMRDVLALEGVVFQSVVDDFRDEQYDVVIDGQIYTIYDQNVLSTWNSWTIATKRALEIVSDILQSAGSGEQLFGIYGGNDGRAILLTNEMHGLLKSSGLITDRQELPFSPSAMNSDGMING